MRIFLTRLFALIPLALLICGHSYWTEKSPFVAAFLFVAGTMAVGVGLDAGLAQNDGNAPCLPLAAKFFGIVLKCCKPLSLPGLLVIPKK